MPIPWDALWQAMLVIAGGIVTLAAAGTAIFKMFNPYKRIVKRLDEIEARLTRHDDLFRRDLERFEAGEETDTMMLKALFTLIEHARTNNSTGLMEATSKEMQAFLIGRK